MKSTLALAVILATVAVVCNSSAVRNTRANLNVGRVVPGDINLHKNTIYRAPVVNTVQSQDLVWRGNATNRITAIQAFEYGYTQYATPKIIGGGIGFNNVTIRFTSAKGRGYYYLVDIWGR